MSKEERTLKTSPYVHLPEQCLGKMSLALSDILSPALNNDSANQYNEAGYPSESETESSTGQTRQHSLLLTAQPERN